MKYIHVLKVRIARTIYLAVVIAASGSLVAFGSLFATGMAHASVLTCTWTGAGDGSSWNESSNWSTCASSIPQNGDNLAFNTISSTIGNLDNNISNLQVGSIAISGSGMYPYNIVGNAISLSGGITDTSQSGGFLDLGITLTANQTFSTTGLMEVGDNTLTLATGGYTLDVVNYGPSDGVIIGSQITGNGAIDFSSANGHNFIDSNNPSFSGPITINSGVLIINASNTNQLGTGSVTIASGGSLQESINTTGTYAVANPITLVGTGASGAGALIVNAYSSSGTVNFNGAITLTGDAQVGLTSANADIAGTVSGCGYSIAETSGSSGGTLSGNLSGSCTSPSSSSSSKSSSSDPSLTPDTGYGEPAQSHTFLDMLVLAAVGIAGTGLLLLYLQKRSATDATSRH